MRRVLFLVVAGGLVVWLERRRRDSKRRRAERVVIGFADGSSTTLEVGSPERELLIEAAGGAW